MSAGFLICHAVLDYYRVPGVTDALNPVAEGETLHDACVAADAAAAQSVAVKYVMPSLPKRGEP